MIEVPRTVVHLVRHGEVHNPGRILYGRLPGFHLSDLGRRQAAAAAELLRTRGDIAEVRTSPLERARETADTVTAALGLAPAQVDERLIESANQFEGSRPGFHVRYLAPAAWRRYRNPWQPSWGEPYRDIVARMQAVVDDVRRAHPGGQVVLVSHQSPIWVTRRAYEQRRLSPDPRRRQCSHASVTTVTFEGDHLVDVGYADPGGQE